MKIDAKNLDFSALNKIIKESSAKTLDVINCNGQRYIGSGAQNKTVNIFGTPGNALGAYLDNTRINVFGNAQDAAGDTMGSGMIAVHGCSGDATGYAMRGGEIYIKGDVGCRAGIHMKSYKQHKPVLVIGGSAGNFLGEYLAGGDIIVLGINCTDRPPVGAGLAAGMHGGRIFVRTEQDFSASYPPNISCKEARAEDIKSIVRYLESFADKFGFDCGEILRGRFLVLSPDNADPYKRLYVNN